MVAIHAIHATHPHSISFLLFAIPLRTALSFKLCLFCLSHGVDQKDDVSKEVLAMYKEAAMQHRDAEAAASRLLLGWRAMHGIGPFYV